MCNDGDGGGWGARYLNSPRSSFVSAVLLEVRDFTGDFQIIEEEITQTKLNVVDKDIDYNPFSSVKPSMDHHGSGNPEMLLHSGFFGFPLLHPSGYIPGAALCGVKWSLP